MRPYLVTSALLLLSSCVDTTQKPPPSSRLVYPSGVAFWRPEVTSSTNGFLYVAGANFDKCYESGAVTALDLDALGLRPFGKDFADAEELASFPALLTDLKVDANRSYVRIDSFAGEMTLWTPPGRSPRLFVPTRAEGSYLQVIDVADDGLGLTCAQSTSDRDCRVNALSLVGVPGANKDGVPGAPAPLGVTVDRFNPDGRVWVTHTELVGPQSTDVQQSDLQGYLVNLPAAAPTRETLTTSSFVPLGVNGLLPGAAHSVAIGSRYLYASGRSSATQQLGTLSAAYVLRLVDRTATDRVLESDVRSIYSIREARGVAVVSRPRRDDPTQVDLDRERVYLLARGPDTLLIIDIEDARADLPTLRVVSAQSLPEGASELEVIPRAAGRGNLVAVTGSGDEAVSIYDEEVGQLVAQVLVGDQDPAQPSQPYGLTADVRGNSARLFTTTFGDGRVAVIDIPNLDRPQDARRVALLGVQQLRDTRQGTSVCQESSP
ncbi:YncE family protein [Myxococcus faecalis]|uniref:YncE family protein n=1 Tax=Myxococcus faecalis TaxID=3115646 RepID=UPI003CF4B6EB